jgi:hypothetical protein
VKNQINLKFSLIIALILFVAFSRVIPHMPNYSPMTAVALFGMVHFDKKWLAILVTFIATFLSDLVLNNTLYAHMFTGFTVFYEGFIWQYLALAIISIIGLYVIKKLSAKNVIFASIISTAAFFLISNFGAFLSLPMYPKTFFGLTSALTAGVPFLKATLLSDLVYSSLLFGGYYLLQSRYAALRLAHVQYA